MKKQKNVIKTNQEYKYKKILIIPSANTCISCGALIPEGRLVCIACETGVGGTHCVICDKPLPEGESVCPWCQITVLHSNNE